MIEKDCETCKEVMKVFGDYSPCVACYLYLSHNNCIPCFKAGKGHFYKVWKHYPEQFERAIQMEKLIGYTVFQDASLAELAEFWKQQDINQELDFGDEGVPCMCAS